MLRPNDDSENRIVSALDLRSRFGSILRRVEDRGGSVVIEKRGRPRAVLLSLKDYVRLAAPEPEVLRLIGDQSKSNGTDKLTSRQIDRVIASARKQQRGKK